MGWVVNATPRPLHPWERPSTHCIGSWVGPTAGLDGCGKCRSVSLYGQFFFFSRLQVARLL